MFILSVSCNKLVSMLYELENLKNTINIILFSFSI